MFEHTLRVRFHHADPAGIAFFGRLFEYAHEAFEEFLLASGVPIAAAIREGGVKTPVVHVDADFARPLRHGDLIRVRLFLGKLSLRSFRVEYTLHDEAGAHLARVALTHAGMGAPGQGADLPADLRAALQTLPAPPLQAPR